VARVGDSVADADTHLAGAQIELDSPALLSRTGEQMHVNLVGAETCSALTQLSEIERRALARQMASGKHRTAAVCIAMHENEVALRNLGAIDKAVDRMNVASARCAAPEMEAIGKVCRGGINAFELRTLSRAASSDFSEMNDTRSHNGQSLAALKPITPLDYFEHDRGFQPKYGSNSVNLRHSHSETKAKWKATLGLSRREQAHILYTSE
jgi:hypothetical protein